MIKSLMKTESLDVKNKTYDKDTNNKRKPSKNYKNG